MCDEVVSPQLSKSLEEIGKFIFRGLPTCNIPNSSQDLKTLNCRASKERDVEFMDDIDSVAALCLQISNELS